MNKLATLLFLIILSACSKDNASDISDIEEEIQEPTVVLDLVKVEKISDTPNDEMGASIVYNDKLYIVDDHKTYEYDFVQSSWNLIAEDEDEVLPGNWYFYSRISFIRNGKWNIFCDNGLFEYDFQNKKWTAVQLFPNNDIYFIHGFYLDDVIYFVDQANFNPNIYKYDFASKEVTIHGNFDSYGNRNSLSKQVFNIGNTYYYVTQSTRGFTFYKFSEDYKNLELLFSADDSSVPPLQSLPNGIAFSDGENIIFGISGKATRGTDGNLYDSVINKELYVYNTSSNEVSIMPTPFYEECSDGNVVSYNNEHFLLYGRKVKDMEWEYRKTMEKLYFDYVEQ